MFTAAELAHLDSLTEPTFGFPQNMQPIFPATHNGGTMVNGVHALPSAFVLEKTARPYYRQTVLREYIAALARYEFRWDTHNRDARSNDSRQTVSFGRFDGCRH